MFFITALPYVWSTITVGKQLYGGYNQMRQAAEYWSYFGDALKLLTGGLVSASATSMILKGTGMYIANIISGENKKPENENSEVKTKKISQGIDVFLKEASLKKLSEINIEYKHILYTFITSIILFMEYTGVVQMQEYVNRDGETKQKDRETFEMLMNKTKANQKEVENDTTFEKYVKEKYENEAFYTQKKGILSGITPKNFQLVRFILNIFIGAMVHANKFIGIESDTPKNNIEKISTWAQLFMYWEILAHLLKIHGVAPVYTALRAIATILKQSTVEDKVDINKVFDFLKNKRTRTTKNTAWRSMARGLH